MKKGIYSRFAFAAILLGLAFTSAAARSRNFNVNTHGDVSSCEAISLSSEEEQVARAQEVITAPNSPSGLRLNAGSRGGIIVRGNDRQDYSIQVCKAAAGADQAAADAMLRQVSVRLEGNEIVSRGPEAEDWFVYLIVDAPKHGTLEAETINGPLSFRDFDGKATVQAKNGPISFRNCAGEIKAEVQNGPVSFKGSGGDLHLKAHNGPVSVELAGNSWSGAGLEASTVNGPVSLNIPENFQSGVRVEMSGHSPVRCRAKACEQANRNWSDEEQRSIQFNGPNPLVKVSTVNGPVSIDDRRADY